MAVTPGTQSITLSATSLIAGQTSVDYTATGFDPNTSGGITLYDTSATQWVEIYRIAEFNYDATGAHSGTFIIPVSSLIVSGHTYAVGAYEVGASGVFASVAVTFQTTTTPPPPVTAKVGGLGIIAVAVGGLILITRRKK